MEGMTGAMAHVPIDTCPKELRAVLERWKQGKATNAELIEASYYAQLDMLNEYRRRSLPTPPEAVRYQRANPDVRMSGKDAEEYHRKYAAFFDQEQQIVNRNHSNLLTLQELLAWAKGKQMPEQIIRAIDVQLTQHRDVTIEEPEPLAV